MGIRRLVRDIPMARPCVGQIRTFNVFPSVRRQIFMQEDFVIVIVLEPLDVAQEGTKHTFAVLFFLRLFLIPDFHYYNVLK